MSCSYADGLSEYHDKVEILILCFIKTFNPKQHQAVSFFSINVEFKAFFQGKLGLPETFDGPDIVDNKVRLIIDVRLT